MSKKRFLAFTGIRSDYDLMSGLYMKLHAAPDTELGLIVAGSHLSKSYGNTVQHIENDKLPIIARIDSLIDGDRPSCRVKSAAVLLQSCLPIVESFKPDALLYAGDREDVMVGGLISAYMSIPSVHFFGGDHASDGNVDNPVRHATSKLSTYHFVNNQQHKDRLLKLGEPAERISVVGSPSLDKLLTTPQITKAAVLEKMGRPEWQKYAVIIFHPILEHFEKAAQHFEEVLSAVKSMGIPAFVSYPNTDAGNKGIIEVIEKYKQAKEFCFYHNLTRDLFINLMRNASLMVGNSSAGLYEAPLLKLGVVNVGLRQKNRLAAENVLFVEQGIEEVKKGISSVLSDSFQAKLKTVESPYGNGKSVQAIYERLKNMNFNKLLYKYEDPLTAGTLK